MQNQSPPQKSILYVLQRTNNEEVEKSVDIHIHWNGIDKMFMPPSGVGYVLEKGRDSVYICACLSVLISFIYSSAGRSADASERERKDRSGRQKVWDKVWGWERNPEIYPSIHPSRMLRLIFETYSATMNNECREAKICVERYRHLEKRMGKSISFSSNWI